MIERLLDCGTKQRLSPPLPQRSASAHVALLPPVVRPSERQHRIRRGRIETPTFFFIALYAPAYARATSKEKARINTDLGIAWRAIGGSHLQKSKGSTAIGTRQRTRLRRDGDDQEVEQGDNELEQNGQDVESKTTKKLSNTVKALRMPSEKVAQPCGRRRRSTKSNVPLLR
jgi:hypothetical protein